MSRRRPSGFTLIELMISVAIVGILSSVALPNFRNLQLRSRQAERRTMVRMLETATEDLWVRDGRWPQGTPAASTFDGPWNPPLPPSTSKREWDRSPTNGDWAALTLGIEGSLYYSYRVDARAGAGTRSRIVYAVGDLDGDGATNVYARQTRDYVAGTTPIRDQVESDNGGFADVF